MAVRFDAAGENYSASGGLPGNTYTFTAWVLLAATSLTDNNVVYWFTNGSDVFTGIEVRSTLNDLQGYDSGTYSFNGLGPLAVSANTWYRCALVVNGANATFYRAAAGSALGSASASDFTTPTTPNEFFLGDDRYDEYWNGRLAAVKVWTAALTQAEVEHELAQYAPARTANLIRFHPFVKPETTDYSGAGNTLSGGSGTTTEDGPPIPWQITAPQVILPAAAAGTTALAEAATATGTANDAAISVAVSSEAATGSGVAHDPQPRVVAGVENAAATGTAESPTVQIATTAETAAAAAVAEIPSVAITVVPDTATATGAALDAVVAVGTLALAEVAEGTGTALDATLAVAPSAEHAAAVGVAETPTIAVTVHPDAATGAGVAEDAVVVTSGAGTALAEAATGVGAALDASAAVAVSAETATASGVAEDPWANIGVSAQAAEGTGTAHDAGIAVTVTAEPALATGVAHDATVYLGGITAFAEAAEATGVAYDATVLTVPRPAGAGWYTLLAISQEARDLARDEAARRPVACPNCGEPLQAGPGGVLHCRFDGYRA